MKRQTRRVYKDRDGNKLPSVTELLGGLGWKYAPLLEWQKEQRRKHRAIKRTGIIHCPADGRETTLIEIPAKVRYIAQQLWPRLVEMSKWKADYDDFGKELRKIAKANEEEPPKPSTPF